MPNNNEDQVASSSTNVNSDAVYYPGKEQDDVTAFKKSTQYELFKKQYERAIDQLIAFSNENNIVYSANNGTDVHAKNQFALFKDKIFGNNTGEHDSHLYYQAKQAIEHIVQLLEGKETSKENKITSLRELAKNILQCTDGTCSYIVKTRLELSGNVGTLSERMQGVKQQLAEQVIVQYVRDNRDNIAEKYVFDQRFVDKHSVHFFNMYHNLFSEKLGIPPQQSDQYVEHIVVSAADRAAVEKILMETLTPYNISASLAEKYKDTLREAVGNNPEEIQIVNDVIEAQKAIYGDMTQAVLSIADDDDAKWWINPDPTPLQMAIAKKLAAEEIPSVHNWPISWKIKTFKEEGAGNKLQHIGDLFWWEKKDPHIPSATIISEPGIQDFSEPTPFDQMASGQLIRLLGQAPGDGNFKAFFKRIKPEQLRAANSAQMTAFFVKLGYDDGIAYVRAHPDFFSTLNPNPLIDFFLTLPDNQFAQIDPTLLYRMNESQLRDFTAKLGGEDQLLGYVKTHQEWFENNGGVLLKTNPLIPAILRLKGDERADIPTAFLNLMTYSELQQFFKGMGELERVITYCESHELWFENQLKSLNQNPLLPFILTFSGDQLKKINPDLLYRITDQDLEKFFNNMGSLELTINYARSHFIWFSQLYFNPLIPFFLTLSAEQLFTIPANILLHKAFPKKIAQYLEKMGSELALKYIQNHTAAFHAESSTLISHTLDEIPLLSIDVKRALLEIAIKTDDGIHFEFTNRPEMRSRLLNKLLIRAINGKDQEIVQLSLFHEVRSKNEISAAISRKRKRHLETDADEPGLKQVEKFLDTVKNLSATPENRIAAAVHLSHYIGSLGADTHDSRFYPVLSELDKSIHDSLFEYLFVGTSMSDYEDFIVRLEEWMKKQPELGAFFYLKIATQDLKTRSQFAVSMLDNLKTNPYCRSLQGFNGQKVENLIFQPTFHIPLGEQYHRLEALLLQAKASGLVKTFLNEQTQSLHLGHTYQELTHLSDAHPEVKAVIDLVHQVVQAANADGQEPSLEMLMLDKYADKEYLYRFQRERLTSISAKVSLSLSSKGLSSVVPEINQRPVNKWAIPDITTQQDDGTMNFAGQIILQLEDDAQVLAAAKELAGKHPKLSVIVQLDAQSHPRVVYGDPSLLQGNLRWQVVGHGRGGKGERNHQTLGGRTASALAFDIKQLSSALRINHAGLSQDLDPNYVSLVGCSLTNQDNQQGYAYQLGVALNEQGIPADIGARIGPVDVNQYGEKITEDSHGNWQHKISTDKVVLRWNKQGKILGQDYNINTLKEKNGLMISIDLAENFQQAMTNLYRSNRLQADKWLPILNSLTRSDRKKKSSAVSPKSYSIEVVSQADGQIRKLTFNDPRIIDFIEHYNGKLASVRQQYQAIKEKNASSVNFNDVEAIDGLNAGIIVKTLISWFANKSRHDVASNAMPSTLNTALQVHTYVGLTQMAHGSLEDMVKISKLYQAVSSEGKAVGTGLSSLSKMSPILGIVLNSGSVVLDGIELAHAQNAAQKAVFGTQLFFDGAALATSVVGISAGLAGAATVAGFTGPLAVPLAGLGIGFTALAQNFGEIAENAKAVGNYFADLDAAYQQGGYRRVEKKSGDGSAVSLLEPIPGAVIKTLDLKNKQITFDSQYIYRNDPGFSVGSSKNNYFLWWPGRSYNEDKAQAINIREGICHSAQTSFIPDKGLLILPMTPKSFIGYDYMPLPFCTGRHDRGFDVLRRLEQDGRFDYDFYVFPSERIIHKITHEFVSTPVEVILDTQDRDIIIPRLPDAINGKLSYHLIGDGGQYGIILQYGCALSLQSGNSATHWRLDARELKNSEEEPLNIDIHDDHLQIGEMRITLDLQRKGTISVINNNNTRFGY